MQTVEQIGDGRRTMAILIDVSVNNSEQDFGNLESLSDLDALLKSDFNVNVLKSLRAFFVCSGTDIVFYVVAPDESIQSSQCLGLP